MGLPVWGIDAVLAIGAVLLLLSVLASKAASKTGIPALIVFVVIGMLAGSEGIGGIYFDDAEVARTIGTVALALILFAGGLDTEWRAIRPVVVPGIVLATLGVALTAGLVAVFAIGVFGFGIKEGLLLGAIVSSTDAAAVFAVLRARGIRLRRRLGPLIELESGSNDPMAVFLTVGLTGLIAAGSAQLGSLVPEFIQQMALGAACGWGLGRLAPSVINRLHLAYDGLYPALTLGFALLAYAGTQLVGGNGFLAVYVAGVTMSNQPFVHRWSLRRFHDGVAWLMQIGMFLVLGLLVFPSRLPSVALEGIALSLFLMLVARPLAVVISLAPFRTRWRERLFVGWVGLRGAVPIILATIPLTAGIGRADRIFDLVFFAVLFSVALQGSTIGSAARWLGVAAPVSTRPEGPSATQANMVEVRLMENCPGAGRRVVDLNLPNTAMIVLLTRGERSFVPQGSTLLRPGDRVVIATRKDDLAEILHSLGGEVRLVGPAGPPPPKTGEEAG